LREQTGRPRPRRGRKQKQFRFGAREFWQAPTI